jgi:hypothetical protein
MRGMPAVRWLRRSAGGLACLPHLLDRPLRKRGGHDLPPVETGLLADRSAVFRVLGQIEALGLELLELRQIRARRESPESGGARSPDGVGV